MKRTVLLVIIASVISLSASAQWTTVCDTGNGMIVGLANYDGSVYASGFFTNIGGASAAYVARWDGANWFAVDPDLPDAGHNIRAIDTSLYLAQYREAVDSNWVKRWDGTHFAKVGAGVYLSTVVGGAATDLNPNIYDVVQYRGTIVASGEFDIVGGISISRIMQWNGTQWDSLGAGLTGSMDGSGVLYPHQMLVVDTSLYVIGNFKYAGGVLVNGVARWDGTSWHAMGAGFDNFGYGMAVVNGDIYAGGEFRFSGTTPLQRIAKWDGTQWVHPGFGVNYSDYAAEHAYVHTIGQIGTRGIFEGGFNQVIVGTDTFTANNIFSFDGTNIDTLAGGVLNANFEGLIPFEATFLTGGAIWSTSGVGVSNLSKYEFSPAHVATVQEAPVSVYPNPFSSSLTLAHAKKGCTISVFDMLGRLVYRDVADNSPQVLTLTNLPQGDYMLQLAGKGQTQYKKLIKE